MTGPIIETSGPAGLYKRNSITAGKVTRPIAARPYGLPLPPPEPMYHATIPNSPPKKVARSRLTRAKVVSPEKTASAARQLRSYAD